MNSIVALRLQRQMGQLIKETTALLAQSGRLL